MAGLIRPLEQFAASLRAAMRILFAIDAMSKRSRTEQSETRLDKRAEAALSICTPTRFS